MMTNESLKIFWIVLWTVVSAGWSLLSFQWLKKSVDKMEAKMQGGKMSIGPLLLRRMLGFVIIALLFFLALKTEPLAIIAMVLTITIMTWVQVIIYNKKMNKNMGVEEI
ncbi:MAG TPA: hypothetical protein GX730_09280 [Chloroflexi bacterium]|nr:hypothetical protein [Chloroflexota bacterium]